MKFHHSLSNVFGSRARLEVLETLLRWPQKAWTGRALSAESNVSPPQTQQALRHLESNGLVFSRPAGKSRLWMLNPRHIFLPQLQKMLAVREDFQTMFLQTLRQKLASNSFGKIQQITLFGSVARGADESDSDVDVLLVVSDPKIAEEIRQTCLDVAVELMDRFDKVAMPLVFSAKDLPQKNPHLLKNIRSDGITFYEAKS